LYVLQQNFSQKDLKKGQDLGDWGVNERIILKLILNIYGIRMWTGIA
jgi:hypothetical protein